MEMKKSLIALAVLGAFAGAAAAQSSATLYGKIDMGYGIGNGGGYEGSQGDDSKFQQWGNSNSTSRWGLKGQEDLGNGTAVYFQLESKISPETGSTGSNLFDRAAYVGIKGGFGAIQAGRQNTVINNVLGQYDITGSPNITSSLGNVGISAISQSLGATNYTRLDSAIAYVSPNFSGFSFQGAAVLKNDAVFAKTVYTVGASYANGPFSIGAAFESKPADGMSSSWGIGAKVNMTSFVISGGYFDNHMDGDGKGFYLGAALPINAFTIGAQVAMNTDAGDDDPLAFELFAKYKLSDRTQLYAQTGMLNKDAERWMGASRKYSASLGIIHNF
ncbi:MAG: porin [Saezia sp.]